jgi:ligand-binding sensor domain-containing protein
MTVCRARLARALIAGGLSAAVLCSPAEALDPAKPLHEFTHDHWGHLEGLPQESVQAVLQSQDGHLWIGTQEGLVRFNGVSFRVFDRTEYSLPSNHVLTLLERPDGRLLVGTYGGLTEHVGRHFETPAGIGGFEGERIQACAEDRSGGIWIGTAFGLTRIAGQKRAVFGVDDGLPSSAVNSLLPLSDGSVWIGTEGGLARFWHGRIERVDALGAGRALRVAALASWAGSLLVGTESGLDAWDGHVLKPVAAGPHAPHSLVRAVLVDRSGAIWAGTEGEGLWRLWGGAWSQFATANGLTSNTVTALYEDRQSNLWIGTDAGGLNRLRESKVISYNEYDGLSRPVVYSVTGEGDHGLWVGSDAGDVDRLDLAAGHATPVVRPRALHAARVRSLAAAGQDLWIGTEKGLFRLRGGSLDAWRWDVPALRGSIRALRCGRDGTLWVGTDRNGVVALRKDGGVTRYGLAEGLPNEEIRVILEDRRGRVWIGTNGGLVLLDGGHFRVFTVSDGLVHDFVRCLLEDEDGALWIGTYGGGLSRLKNGEFFSVSTRQGLFSDVIYSLLDDGDGRLWMSCNRGIFSVAKREIEDLRLGRVLHLSVTVLGREDGMDSPECNGGSPGGWKTPDGRLWFPTLKGIVGVDPTSIHRSLEAPPTIIESATADGMSLDLDARAVLGPATQRIEFRYAAISLVASDRIQYRFRLEGLDTDWVDAHGERVATYTSLRPRSYLFRVRASNPDGVWDDVGASYAFEITPALHQRPWFIAVVVLGGIGAVAGLYRWRMSRVALHERQLQIRIDEALAEINTLSGLLPICSACKNIRDDRGYWNQLEDYLRRHAEVQFSHGLCPDCIRRLYPEYADAVLSPDAEEGSDPD